MSYYHLAQFNIARLIAARDDPRVAEFFARIDEINALGEASPGFVWRLQTDEGNATSLHPYGDDMIIVNMSVWESIELLKAFAYKSAHNDVMRKRRQWFEPHQESYLVMWWVPTGYIPTVQEAKARLAYLQQHGETEHAFTFKRVFQPTEDGGRTTDEEAHGYAEFSSVNRQPSSVNSV